MMKTTWTPEVSLPVSVFDEITTKVLPSLARLLATP